MVNTYGNTNPGAKEFPKIRLGGEAQVYNLSYLGNGDWEDHGLR
jgi:hypothetical protein